MPALLPVPSTEEGTFTWRTMEHYSNNLYSNWALGRFTNCRQRASGSQRAFRIFPAKVEAGCFHPPRGEAQPSATRTKALLGQEGKLRSDTLPHALTFL